MNKLNKNAAIFFLESAAWNVPLTDWSAARFTQYLTEKSTGRRRPQGGSTVRLSPCHKNAWLKATLSLSKSEQPVPIFFFFFFGHSDTIQCFSTPGNQVWKHPVRLETQGYILIIMANLVRSNVSLLVFSIVELAAAASTIWTRFNLRKNTNNKNTGCFSYSEPQVKTLSMSFQMKTIKHRDNLELGYTDLPSGGSTISWLTEFGSCFKTLFSFLSQNNHNNNQPVIKKPAHLSGTNLKIWSHC